MTSAIQTLRRKMGLRIRTTSYWKQRSMERLLKSEKTTRSYMKQVEKIYIEAQRQILKDLMDLYAKCYKKETGFDKKLLDLIISEQENKATIIKIEKLGLNDVIPDRYKGRISRLENLNRQI